MVKSCTKVHFLNSNQPKWIHGEPRQPLEVLPSCFFFFFSHVNINLKQKSICDENQHLQVWGHGPIKKGGPAQSRLGVQVEELRVLFIRRGGRLRYPYHRVGIPLGGGPQSHWTDSIFELGQERIPSVELEEEVGGGGGANRWKIWRKNKLVLVLALMKTEMSFMVLAPEKRSLWSDGSVCLRNVRKESVA